MQNLCTSWHIAGTGTPNLVGVLVVVGAAAWTTATPARAVDDARVQLTLAEIVELARTSAYESRFASLDVEDARARLVGAQQLVRDNPSVQASAGPRFGDPVSVDAAASVGVPVEIGVRRGRAVKLAEDEVRRDQFRLEGVQRGAVVDAVATYLRGLHASERLSLATERRAIAEQLVSTAVERERAGDASRFEVNLARAELARSTSQVLEAERMVQVMMAELSRILAVPIDSLKPVGGALDEAASLQTLRAALGTVDVPQLKEAAAETDAANAAVALAETAWWPDVAVQGNYMLDDGEHIATAGLSFTIPVFANGQQERRAAAVRVERSRLTGEAVRSRVDLERRRATLSLRTATDAARVLADDGLPRAVENESLAREAYRAGKLDLASYVVLRRDSLETRQEHLDRLLERGLAALDVATLGGPENPPNLSDATTNNARPEPRKEEKRR